MELFEGLKQKIGGKKVTIVFPEPTDARVLGAAVRLKSDDLIEPILIGNPSVINEIANSRGLIIDNLKIVEAFFKIIGNEDQIHKIMIPTKFIKN